MTPHCWHALPYNSLFFLPQPGPNVWLTLGKCAATRFRSGEGKRKRKRKGAEVTGWWGWAWGLWIFCPEASKRHVRVGLGWGGWVSTCANRQGIFITINTLVGTAGWLLDELMYLLPFLPTSPPVPHPAPSTTNRVKWLIKAHGEWAANFISCPSRETPTIWFAHGWRGRSRARGCQLSSTDSYGNVIRGLKIEG